MESTKLALSRRNQARFDLKKAVGDFLMRGPKTHAANLFKFVYWDNYYGRAHRGPGGGLWLMAYGYLMESLANLMGIG